MINTVTFTFVVFQWKLNKKYTLLPLKRKDVFQNRSCLAPDGCAVPLACCGRNWYSHLHLSFRNILLLYYGKEKCAGYFFPSCISGSFNL